MSIEIKAIEPRDKERQVAFFVIDGQEFSCGNVPAVLTKTEEIQVYLDSRVGEFKLILLKREYPGADHLRFQKDGMTELEAMAEWIQKGHKNKVVVSFKDEAETKPVFGYVIIQKQELRYRHPKEIALKPLLDKATTVSELKAVINQLL